MMVGLLEELTLSMQNLINNTSCFE